MMETEYKLVDKTRVKALQVNDVLVVLQNICGYMYIPRIHRSLVVLCVLQSITECAGAAFGYY